MGAVFGVADAPLCTVAAGEVKAAGLPAEFDRLSFLGHAIRGDSGSESSTAGPGGLERGVAEDTLGEGDCALKKCTTSRGWLNETPLEVDMSAVEKIDKIQDQLGIPKVVSYSCKLDQHTTHHTRPNHILGK